MRNLPSEKADVDNDQRLIVSQEKTIRQAIAVGKGADYLLTLYRATGDQLKPHFVAAMASIACIELIKKQIEAKMTEQTTQPTPAVQEAVLPPEWSEAIRSGAHSPVANVANANRDTVEPYKPEDFILIPKEDVLSRSPVAAQEPKWCDFGDDFNNLLNRTGCYFQQKGVTANDALKIINAGISAHAALNQIIDDYPLVL